MGRMNLRLAVTFAFCVFGTAIFWCATLTDQASFGQFALPRFFQGLGLAFFFLPLNQILLSGLRPDELATASGLSNFIRTMSGSFATAITVWVWNRRTEYHHAVLSEHVRDAASGWLAYRAQLAALGIEGQNAFDHVDALITQQALTMGVNDVFFALGCLYFLLIPFIWLARPPFGARRGGGAH
jgi:DHA2 family multidrug resistance protein